MIMIVLFSCVFLVFTLVSPTVLTQTQNPKPAANSSWSKALGPSACFLSGTFNVEKCKLETVLCNQLPSECSSYIFAGARVDATYDVYNAFGDENDAYLQKLLKCTKVPVYVTYGYETLALWSLVLACNAADGVNVKYEVEGLKAFLDRHKTISGILFNNLDIIPKQASFEDFSPNFKSYLTLFKELMPELEIGMLLYADEIQMHYKNPVVQWIDFKEVIELLDYVVISFTYFNKCGKEFVHGGVVPITGNAEYTIEKTLVLLHKAGITKEKLHFRYDLFPTNEESYSSLCTNTFPKMCKNPKIAVKWCADTIATYYEKGLYAKKYTSGFVGSAVDMDDVHCDCKCGRSFPAFRAILDGFNGASVPPPCLLLDRCK